MAHFAELKQKTDPTGFTSDKHWIVERVIVVDNKHVPGDEHVDGETWCKNMFGEATVWKQTSYNHNFRKQYCGIGCVYDEAKNKFLSPQPYASWALDANDDWQAPVAYPTILTYGDPETHYSITWDEAGQKWTASDRENNLFNWDASGLTWVSA
jgi:hypothetical protein|tara:strand:- start:169 stop:630 length:462 start_codon:yes stop_codon:yes gene_type:complete